MSFFKGLKKLAQGVEAQVNPFDGGQTFQSVMRNQQPPQQPMFRPPVQQQSPVTSTLNALVNPLGAIGHAAASPTGRQVIQQAAQGTARTLPELAMTVAHPGDFSYHPNSGFEQALFGPTPIQNIQAKVHDTQAKHGTLAGIGEGALSLLSDLPVAAGATKGAKAAVDAGRAALKVAPAVDGATTAARAAESVALPEVAARTNLKLPTAPAKPQSVFIPPTRPEAADKVVAILGGAKKSRLEQEALQSQARSQKLGRAMGAGERVSGQAGYHAQLGALKGELPKANFQGLQGQLPQQDIDQLFNAVRSNPNLRGFDQINTEAALSKLFTPDAGAPTRTDIKLLKNAFGEDFGQAVENSISGYDKFKQGVGEVANLPRTLMSSFDLSAPFRQGLVLSARYPKQFSQAFGQMLHYAGSENAYKQMTEEIASRPSFELMRKSGLALTDVNSGSLSGREEQFMSNLGEKIPVIGRGVRGSDRAYTGFLNKLRADVFDHLVTEAQAAGLDVKGDPVLTKHIARFVNAASGRGELPGSLANSAVALNSFFFSPRLMASRLQILNPVYYARLHPFVRKQALLSTASLGGIVLTVLGLAKAAGAEVGVDPTNADFGKIKIGNTRIDIGGGFQQYIKLAAQLAEGKITSSTTGKEISLTEDGFGKMNRQDILIRFLQGKENPNASLVTDYLTGHDFQGNKFSLPKELGSRLVPMGVGNFTDVAKDQGIPAGLATGAIGTVGFGVQNYAPKPTSPNQPTKTAGVGQDLQNVVNNNGADQALTAKDYLTPDEQAFLKLDKAQRQQYLADHPGDQYLNKATALERTAKQLAGNSLKVKKQELLSLGVPQDAATTLSNYDRLSETGKAKFKDNPKTNYQYEAAKFQSDKAQGKLSKVDEYDRRNKLGKLKIESGFSREVLDLYGMSKTTLNDYIAKNPTRQAVIDQVLQLDKKLADAGFISKTKFGGTTAFKAKGGRKGGSSAKGRLGSASVETPKQTGYKVKSSAAPTVSLKKPTAKPVKATRTAIKIKASGQKGRSVKLA